MKALVKDKKAPGLTLKDIPLPKIKPDEVLLKISNASICGTDLHIYEWDKWAQDRIKPPLILGHEICGEVVEVGKSVTLFKKSDFVSAESHIPCLTCPVCRNGQAHICANLKILGVDTDGGFAEYALLPEIILWKNDSSLSRELGSIQEPLGNAVYSTLVEPVAGKTVLVWGDGPAGLNAVAVAKAGGAAKIYLVGRHDFRINLGKKMGADKTFNVEKEGYEKIIQNIFKETDNIGVDVVLEKCGAQAASDASFKVLRKGGRFSAFGIPKDHLTLDWANAVIFKGATVYGINGRRLWQDWQVMAGLEKSGRLDVSPLITHKFKLEDFEKAFQLAKSPERKVGKIVLLP